MFEQRFQQKSVKPKQRKCKIVIKKKGDRIEKSIEGECSPAEIKALSDSNIDIEE